MGWGWGSCSRSPSSSDSRATASLFFEVIKSPAGQGGGRGKAHVLSVPSGPGVWSHSCPEGEKVVLVYYSALVALSFWNCILSKPWVYTVFSVIVYFHIF